MRRAILLIPILGMIATAAVPLVRHVEKARDEARALAAVREVRAAQERFRRDIGRGGYASSTESLVRPCGRDAAPLDDAVLQALQAAGYEIVVTALSTGSPPPSGRDCHDRPLAADYYVSAAPRSASTPAQQAFGARAWGDIYVFFDGIPPRPEEMASGLATRADERETFRIP